jgi:uncharacterized protein DUF5063
MVTATVSDFRALAGEYCALIEEQIAGQPLAQRDFLECLQLCLARLYAAALTIPSVEPGAEQSAAGLTYPEWYRMQEALQGHLPRDTFWEVFDPCWDGPPTVVKFSLADTLTDVYSGLHEGMVASASGTSPDSAAWAWRVSFTSHWGHHVLDALLALDCMPG